MKSSVAIVGATTWGTTLAVILAARDRPVTLLARSEAEAQELNAQRQHSRFLPGVPFPESLTVSSDVGQAISPAELIILAVPSEHFRPNLSRVSEAISSGATILSAAKGLELPQGKRMSQVMEEELPAHLHPGICVLSGPNLAQEIIRGKLSSTVVAGQDPDHCRVAQDILMSNTFRVYTSDDVIGVELGGALKNIIALGAGIADGLDAGDNAKAAFITRGLAEITRLGVAAGAKPLTFAGLAGLGDLVATCSSRLSRNHSVGRQLAEGLSWPEIRGTMDNVAEGVNTTNAALAMAKDLDVEMPIAQTTHRVLFEGLSPQDAVAQLMERPPRSEW
ncbi:MAG: NAD(P)-dependent glycerol-3-phosphate dehydrogenase [Chloroflexi bacterium]|nr:NAD(P)-dependent glycerol-3-phosphate dehydrogenase [Chloroflexota bacterium]